MRRFSNLGHAALLGTGAVPCSPSEARLGTAKTLDPWPGVTAGSGIALSGGLVALSGHHGGPRLLFREDPHQRRHFLMGLITTAGAAACARERFS
jgi:hypothetical protein